MDAVPHVPDHRRLPLLSHLLVRVGPTKFLSVTLGLLVAKHVQQLGVKEQVSLANSKGLNLQQSGVHIGVHVRIIQIGRFVM